jgi:hypothetical protein
MKTVPKIRHLKEFFLDYLTLEDGTDRLSRNMRAELPSYVAKNPKRAQTSFTPRQNPGSTHNFCFTISIRQYDGTQP